MAGVGGDGICESGRPRGAKRALGFGIARILEFGTHRREFWGSRPTVAKQRKEEREGFIREDVKEGVWCGMVVFIGGEQG